MFEISGSKNYPVFRRLISKEAEQKEKENNGNAEDANISEKEQQILELGLSTVKLEKLKLIKNSRPFFGLIGKAKAAKVVRTLADLFLDMEAGIGYEDNSIYCPPKLQASLDLQSGILHAVDENDFKAAYSCFYEAFEGYNSIDNPKALVALKYMYMLLSKIMLYGADEVQGIVSGKLALRYAVPEIDSMKSIANAN
ncbi:hypothetical protein CHUAL_001649 [Chamberlinius hualienensis]